MMPIVIFQGSDRDMLSAEPSQDCFSADTQLARNHHGGRSRMIERQNRRDGHIFPRRSQGVSRFTQSSMDGYPRDADHAPDNCEGMTSLVSINQCARVNVWPFAVHLS